MCKDVENVIEKYSSLITFIIDQTISNYDNNCEDIKRIEREENDLSHEIELSEDSAMTDERMLYLIKQERALKQARRVLKDENEMMQEFYALCKELKEKYRIKDKLSSALGRSRTAVDLIKKRTYTPKERTDLTITDKQVEGYRPFQQMLKDLNDKLADNG